jgi:Protein of unknown function (DUF3015)
MVETFNQVDNLQGEILMLSSKKLVAVALVGMFPLASMADNVGGCGWGSKLFDGQRGVAPQVLGVTTNGTFGNQTFGISSGTSGCTQDGVVKSNWKTAMFINGNKEKLARDMSIGHGETLDALAKLMGVRDEHKSAFFLATKENFGRIYSGADVSTDQILASLKQVLAQNTELAVYATAI